MEKYLCEIKADVRIRDPLYGFIHLTKKELQVVDTPLFQRLRRIHQLALTKYVYPSAEHSRFVHSLGVLHCATLIMTGLFENKLTKCSSIPNENSIKTLRYAALLHDIGHLPFSHAVEKDWLHGFTHEDLSMYIIENYEPIKKVLTDDGVLPNEVSSLLGKRPKAKHKIYHEIVSGQLDADRADYLLRDSFCCGVRYGEYDFSRFLQIFAAKEDDNGVLTLCIDERDLPVAESLLIARYHYNLQIPYHRTRSGFDFALKAFAKLHTNFDNIFSFLPDRIESVDFEQLELLDDGTIMNIVKEKYLQKEYWSKHILRESHLSPLIDTNALSKEGTSRFKDAVRKLSGSSQLKLDEDYFVQEQRVDMIKHSPPANSLEKADDEAASMGTIRLLSGDGDATEKKPVNIRERSWIFGQLNQDPHTIYRIYCRQEKKDLCTKLISNTSKDGGSL